MLQYSNKMFYGYRCPKFYIYWNNKVRHYIFGNEINSVFLFSPFTIQTTTGFFNIIYILGYFAPERSNFS